MIGVKATREAKKAKKNGGKMVRIIYCHKVSNVDFCAGWREGEIREASQREARILLAGYGSFLNNLIN